MSQVPTPQLDAQTLLGFVSAGSPLRVRTHSREEVSVVERTATIQTLAAVRHEISTRRDWKTPLAISATIAAVIPLTDWSWAGERMWVSAGGWMKLFVVAALLTFGWACVLGIRNRTKPGLSPEEIYERIAGGVVTELSTSLPHQDSLTNSDVEPSKGGLSIGTPVRHAHWGMGEVVATRRTGDTDYLTVRFDGPPVHEEEMVAVLASLLRILPGGLSSSSPTG